VATARADSAVDRCRFGGTPQSSCVAGAAAVGSSSVCGGVGGKPCRPL